MWKRFQPEGGPCRGLLCDFEIFAKVRLKLTSYKVAGAGRGRSLHMPGMLSMLSLLALLLLSLSASFLPAQADLNAFRPAGLSQLLTQVI